MLHRDIIGLSTKGGLSFIDITADVAGIVQRSGVKEGTCSVFLPATTAGLLLNEKDRMLLEDFKKLFQSIDEKKIYHHPSNAFAHLRASMLRSDITFPVSKGEPRLGAWQSIILWEFDAKPRKRSVTVTVMGE
ncbi:MAG: YjbQ family protein [Candidatus Aenigmarchaeota archaeon]|nr:YjbQ family protein [Candidatus Aenigmarchaeota archaeon]